ncbi:MAG: DUF2851 family protein [Kiritimatiellae bacterium]|nr:DUF2851 family protein [Kiritimatiellia bacterium]
MQNSVPVMTSFPLCAGYRAIVSPPAARLLRDGPHDSADFPYSERHLRCVWYDPTWRPANLRTNAGEPVEVKHPGRWNLEAGPDFLDARLVIGVERRELHGDVEIHIRPLDWIQHGHEYNPAYRRVLAHVTYFSGSIPANHLPSGAVQISLADCLRSNPAFSFESVDVTAYPLAVITDRTTPCAELFARLSRRTKMHVLEAAGQERLYRKAERLALAIRAVGMEQAFYEEVLSALGYKHNRRQFHTLARLVPLADLREHAEGDAFKAYAILAGAAGLLPTGTSPRWDDETRGFVRRLWDHWWKLRPKWSGPLAVPPRWQLSGIRPINHPLRRLAAAAGIFTKDGNIVQSLCKLPTKDPHLWFARARTLFETNTGIGYWKYRLSLGGRRQNHTVALVGDRRTAAILSNVAIPFLAACGNDVSALLPSLPVEEDSALLRQAATALFGRDHSRTLYSCGLRQQGLIQIFHDFCLNTRTGCTNCPLPAALQKTCNSQET